MTEAEYKPPGTKFLRTDVRYMSRADLFVSSRQFLLVGVLGLVLTATAGLLAVAEPRQEAPNFYALVAMFLLFILSGMGLAGALYLFVRACVRGASYDPREVWLADQLGVDSQADRGADR